MLHPQNNSIEYSTGIAPPDGYELKYAVGTSYSIDLEALLLIPIAMIYASHIEKANGDLTYETISALSEVSKKIDIFCQKGNIKNPKQSNQLYSFWENSIHEVTMASAFQSFHPKVWIMQFVNKQKQIHYKIFITSRNLTQSGDWDIAYSTEGIVGSERNTDNIPLVDFVKYLAEFNNNTIPQDFITNLEFTKFDIPDNWKSQFFLPIGIPKYENILQKKKFDDLLVISPFLDTQTINTLNENSNSLTLFSTRDALDEVDAKKIGTKNFQFNSIIESVADNEETFSEVNVELLSQSLHAKLFIGKKGDTITWNLGSANATNPAFVARNIEFNIELSTKDENFSPKQMLKQLAIRSSKDDKDIKLFEPYQPRDIVSDANIKKLDSQIRKLVFDLGNTKIEGTLVKSSNNLEYNFQLTFDTSNTTFTVFKVKVKPLSCFRNDAKSLKENLNNQNFLFENISLAQISQFLIWEIYHDGIILKEFLTKMKIEIPFEERQSKIFKELFDSKEKLFKYISFLITNDENEVINFNTITTIGKDNNNKLEINNLAGLPIYEKLLIASSRMPQKLASISKLIQSLTQNNDGEESTLITNEFKAFWSEFENYMNNSNGKNS